MTTSYKNTVLEMFRDVATLTPERLGGLVEETMKYFQEMQAKLSSGDPALCQEALDGSRELREIIEGQMRFLCEAKGLDPAEIKEKALREALDPEGRAFFELAQKRFSSFLPKKEEHKPKKKKRK